MRGEKAVSIGRYTLGYKRSWKQRLRDWLNDSGEVASEQIYAVDSLSTPRIDADRGINFRVFKAAGGTIVETSFYDRVKDRSHNSLHVITDGEDLGKAIGKIITMETLKI